MSLGCGAGQVTVMGRLWRPVSQALFAFFVAILLVTASAAVPGGQVLANSKYASIVMDELTGEVLYSRQADLLRHPASLTKVMTLYLLFEEITAERIKLTDGLKASKRAAGQPPSKLGIRAGQRIKVKDAIQALVVRSANDVAVVVAESISGTERKFAQRMNKRAKELGMKKTRFRNASGLPNRSQVTTARDMAILCQRIRKDFPQFMDYFEQTKFSWGGRTWRTHNHVLKSYRGADGMKTGYTRASGFNLMTSAERHGVRVIAVVMGGRTASRRDKDMARILDLNYRRIAANPKYKSRRLASLPMPMARPGSSRSGKTTMQVASAETPLPFPAPMPSDPKDQKSEDTVQTVPMPLAFAANHSATEDGQSGSTLVIDVQPAPRLRDTSNPAEDEEVDAIGRQIARAVTFPLPIPDRDEDESDSALRETGTLDAEGPDTLDIAEAAIDDDDIGNDEEAATVIAAITSADMAANTVAEEGIVGENGVMGEGDGRPSARFERLAELAALAASRGSSATQIGIQIGAFLRISTAKRYIENAMAVVPTVLRRNNAAIVQSQTESGTIFRARFGPFSAEDAEEACGLLEAKGMDCFSIEDDGWDSVIRPR